MLCHDTVIPQPAAAHRDKLNAVSIVAEMVLSLSSCNSVVFVLNQTNDNRVRFMFASAICTGGGSITTLINVPVLLVWWDKVSY